MGDITVWQDVWKLPFKLSIVESKVIDSNSRMVFDFVLPIMAKSYNYDVWLFGSEVKNEILNLLNGGERKRKKEEFGSFQIKPEDPDWIYYTPSENSNKEKISRKAVLIRGWGYLTGQGGLSLNPDLAANLQNQLREWICEKLNE